MRQIRFTKEGFENLKKEETDLLHKRKFAVDDLQKSRELGDLSENGFYRAARGNLSSIDSRLRRLTLIIKNSTVITNLQTDTVEIGNTVTLLAREKELTYQIVGDIEADPIRGKISLLSPIGRAIAGRRVGDKVTITVPAGDIIYKIIKIS